MMISIIAPVYNVEPYIKQFLESVLNQTYKDFELIIVDDCSSDNSLSICRGYSKTDIRIKIIESERNAGASHARNVGLAYAKGEFITFIDSDDYLSENALQLCMDEAKRTDSDIVYGGISNDRDGIIDRPGFRWISTKKRYNQNDAIIAHLNMKKLYGYACGKLYRRGILHNVKFPEDMSCGEDGVFSFRALMNAKNGVAYIDRPLYIYRIRKDSSSGHGKDVDNRDFEVFKQIEYVKEADANCQFRKHISVFMFAMYSGTIKKYFFSSENSREQYAEYYNTMSHYCISNGKDVFRTTINPRIKLLIGSTLMDIRKYNKQAKGRSIK